MQNYIGEKEIKELTLDIYPAPVGKKTVYTTYQDDGESYNYREGAYNLYKVLVNNNGDNITINIKKDYEGYERTYHGFKLKVNNTTASKVLVDGKAVDFKFGDGSIEFTVDPCAEIKIIK